MTRPNGPGFAAGSIREGETVTETPPTMPGSILRGPGAIRLGRGALAVLVAVGLGAAPLLAPSSAAALTVLPGEVFEVQFDFADGAPAATVDALVFDVGPGTTATGILGYQVELWDGATLLGSASTAGLQPWAFKKAGSVFDLNPGGGPGLPVVVDFDSIADGSFDGALRLVPQFDPGVPGAQLEIEFFPPPGTGLQLGTAQDESSLALSDPGPTVILTRSVPEPGLAALLPLALLGGAGGAALARRRRRS